MRIDKLATDQNLGTPKLGAALDNDLLDGLIASREPAKADKKSSQETISLGLSPENLRGKLGAKDAAEAPQKLGEIKPSGTNKKPAGHGKGATPAVPTKLAEAKELLAKNRLELESQTPDLESDDILFAVHRESDQKVGALTANNGRADRLNHEEYTGNRQKQIEQLEQKKDKIIAEIKENEKEIDNLDEDVTKKEKRSDIINVVAQVASPGLKLIDGVAGLFGKSANPVKDLANKVQGTQKDRDQLSERNEQLKEQKGDIVRSLATLQKEQTFNFLANVAHVTDMGSGTVGLIDGKSRIPLRIVDSKNMDSDAEFDYKHRIINLNSDVYKDTRTAMKELQAKGIVDGNGKILDPEAFDREANKDSTVATVSLLAAHEVSHAAQLVGDRLPAAKRTAEEIAEKVARGSANQKSGDKIVDAVTTAANILGAGPGPVFYALTELEPYARQEASNMQAGKEQKFLLVTNADGSPLPLDQGAANLMAMYAGRALPYGQNAGQVVPGGAYGSINDNIEHYHDLNEKPVAAAGVDTLMATTNNVAPDSSPGRSRGMGEALPGRSRGMGEALPGRSRGMGESLPGRSRGMGESLPGRSRGM